MVNLEWYRTFKAIYQCGTLTKAAQELLISQPSVSIQLSALETYMGHVLFTRLPRKMVPTELGKQLYTQIVESIANLERVETEFTKSSINKIPNIRLGSPSEVFYTYIAPNISKIESHMDVTYGLAQDLISLLNDNTLDIAIITQKNDINDALTYDPIITERFMILCNNNFDSQVFDKYVQSGDLVNIESWLKQQKWLAYSNNLALIRRFWKENFKKRPLLKIQAVIPDNNAILKAASNSDLLTVSSNILGAKEIEEGNVRILWEGTVSATNTIYLAYNKAKVHPQYVIEIKDFLKMCFETYADMDKMK